LSLPWYVCMLYVLCVQVLCCFERVRYMDELHVHILNVVYEGVLCSYFEYCIRTSFILFERCQIQKVLACISGRCVCIHMHTYIYIYIHEYIDAHAYSCLTGILTGLEAFKIIHAYMHTYTYIQKYMLTHIHIRSPQAYQPVTKPLKSRIVFNRYAHVIQYFTYHTIYIYIYISVFIPYYIYIYICILCIPYYVHFIYIYIYIYSYMNHLCACLFACICP
jgi:hypothetical protein